MAEPKTLIAYAPYGAGVLCAMFYFTRGNDVYGWWLGARDAEFHSAYFMLEDFFTTAPTRLYVTEGMDLYGGWRYQYTAREPALDKPVAVDDAVAHELDRLQGAFAAEWLVFEDDPRIESERAAYGRMGLILGHAAVRSKRIGKLDLSQAVWVYRSPDFDLHMLGFLQRYWPLDYRSRYPEHAV